jgi:hypothetical protein
VEGRLRLAEKERARAKARTPQAAGAGGAGMLLLEAGAAAAASGTAPADPVDLEELAARADANMAALLQEEASRKVGMRPTIDPWRRTRCPCRHWRAGARL